MDYTNDRNYLFGQLKAIHEYTAMQAEQDDIRVLRLHDKYVAHPKTTFVKIESEIMPEMYAKLSNAMYDKVMDAKADIMSKLAEAGFNDEPLAETYLFGYYQERKKLAHDTAGLISLAEYAAKHGKDPSTVRQMAIRGSFTTAQKIGRNWLIDSEEPYPDNRVRSGQYVGWRNKKSSPKA